MKAKPKTVEQALIPQYNLPENARYLTWDNRGIFDGLLDPWFCGRIGSILRVVSQQKVLLVSSLASGNRQVSDPIGLGNQSCSVGESRVAEEVKGSIWQSSRDLRELK